MGRSRKPPRFPLEPLYRVLDLGPFEFRKLRFMTGLGRETERLARFKGGLTPRMADRAATAVGMHPADVWDDWFDRQAPVRRYKVFKEPKRYKRAPKAS